MIPAQQPSQACHNCRRRRLKCDRSLPRCLKCDSIGQECLGYQNLFRWEEGIASRGKMMGKTFAKTSVGRVQHGNPAPLLSLTAGPNKKQTMQRDLRALPVTFMADPLVQDLDPTSRKYLSYFANAVCRDLVLYDSPQHNPFRELIPLTYFHPGLLQIIIANSALHMSNVTQGFSNLDTKSRHSCYSDPFAFHQRAEPYHVALVAKQCALSSLRSAVAHPVPADIDVILAVVLMFIEFELMDSGRDDWRRHLIGARTIINALCEPNPLTTSRMSPLRKFLVSNCLMFDRIGSTFTFSTNPRPSQTTNNAPLSLIQDAEGNHCSSFPTQLLDLIQSAAELLPSSTSSSRCSSASTSQLEEAIRLLSIAESFEPSVWALNLQAHSPATDVLSRTHIAAAHQAAVCIYLSRVQLSLGLDIPTSASLEHLVTDVINHLSLISPQDEIFKAIMWPAFIAGMETNVHENQEWVAARYEELWLVEPWGVIRGALEVLQKNWFRKDESIAPDRELPCNRKTENHSWIEELRTDGVDWLIL